MCLGLGVFIHSDETEDTRTDVTLRAIAEEILETNNCLPLLLHVHTLTPSRSECDGLSLPAYSNQCHTTCKYLQALYLFWESFTLNLTFTAITVFKKNLV